MAHFGAPWHFARFEMHIWSKSHLSIDGMPHVTDNMSSRSYFIVDITFYSVHKKELDHIFSVTCGLAWRQPRATKDRI